MTTKAIVGNKDGATDLLTSMEPIVALGEHAQQEVGDAASSALLELWNAGAAEPCKFASAGSRKPCALHVLADAGLLDAHFGVDLDALHRLVHAASDESKMVWWPGEISIEGSFARIHAAMQLVRRDAGACTTAEFDLMRPFGLRGAEHSDPVSVMVDWLTLVGMKKQRASDEAIVQAVSVVLDQDEVRTQRAVAATRVVRAGPLVSVIIQEDPRAVAPDVHLARESLCPGTVVFHCNHEQQLAQVWLRPSAGGQLSGLGLLNILKAAGCPGFLASPTGSPWHAIGPRIGQHEVISLASRMSGFLQDCAAAA